MTSTSLAITLSIRKGGGDGDDGPGEGASSSTSHSTSLASATSSQFSSASLSSSSFSSSTTFPSSTSAFPTSSPSETALSFNPSERTAKENIGMKIGGIVGGITAGLIVFLLALFFWWRSRRSYYQRRKQRMDMSIGDSPSKALNNQQLRNMSSSNGHLTLSEFSSDAPSTAGFAGVGVYAREKRAQSAASRSPTMSSLPSMSNSPQRSPNASPIISPPTILSHFYRGASGATNAGGGSEDIVEMHEVVPGAPISHRSRSRIQSQIEQLTAENEQLHMQLSGEAPPAYS